MKVDQMKCKFVNWVNMWTIMSLLCGTAAYYFNHSIFGDASMGFGTIAFVIGFF